MKKVIFIGNRSQALRVLLKRPDRYQLIATWVLENSFLHQEIESMGVEYQLFSEDNTSKSIIFEQLERGEYDLLVANGCPFILPISKLALNNSRLFINTHPSYLPELKGKTPLNGVFYLGYDFIGATTHYMNDGIDSGNIIYQEKLNLTNDIDQGLIYYMSFLLESQVFTEALNILEINNFKFSGYPQEGKGTYFNRDSKIFSIDFLRDEDEEIIKKVKSVGITWQGIAIADGERSYTVFEAEKIIHPFLLDLYRNEAPGSIVLKYSNKLLVKSKQGLIKFSHVVK